VGRGGLRHGEPGDRAVGRLGDHRGKGVDARRLEPFPRPGRQIATARALELHKKVGELGVAPRVLLEVLGDAGEERLDADPRGKLLEHRPALGVGDAVEVDLHVVEIIDLGDDRMGGGELVLAVCPGLLHRVERRPGLCPLRGLGGRDGRGPLGERLVEPEIVPPFHRHEVAEPHVGELMEDRHDAPLLDGVGDLAAEDVGLGEGHRAGVLHRAGIELRDEELVVLGEGVRDAELLFVIGEALAGLVEDVLRVEVLPQALAPVDAEGNDASRGAGELGERGLVGAGDDRGDVGRDPRSGLETPGRDAGRAGRVVVQDRLGRGGVGDDLPRRGRGDRELEGGLEVGLLEHREDTTRVGDLELGVEVDLAVDRVDESVEALAGVGVEAVCVDHQHVLLGELLEDDP
ncbi:hypothetical protein ABE10_01725, partial [Bacillus toyonensis]|nr:hypothetical protein [Bacillus toyonensis]